MSDSDEALRRRLAAVERAIDEDADRGRPGDDDREADLERRLAALEARVDELDAAVQAIRGFLGGVSAVNEAVERRADAAVAAVERLERRLDDGPEPVSDASDDVIAFSGNDAGTPDGAGVSDEAGTPDDAGRPNDESGGGGLRDRLRGLR